MKKIFLTLALVIAMCGATYANDAVRCSNDSVVVSERTYNNFANNTVSFYEINRIVVENPKNVTVEIYDANWNLIYRTNDAKIDLKVSSGTYHVVSAAGIKKYFVA